MLSFKVSGRFDDLSYYLLRNCDRGGSYHVDPSILSVLVVFTASFLQFLQFKFIQ